MRDWKCQRSQPSWKRAVAYLRKTEFHSAYTRHPLGDIIKIVFFAVRRNANECGEIESFTKRKEGWLRKYLELPYGVPTDDIYRIVRGTSAPSASSSSRCSCCSIRWTGSFPCQGAETASMKKA